MRKCPRCHTSMLLDLGESVNGYEQMWKCLGCGREMYHRIERQQEEERILASLDGELGRERAR